MYVAKICLNSVRVVLLTSYYGADIRTTPTSGAQGGCHGNTGFLATGRRNLHFMIEYIKMQRPINFKIGTYIQDVVLVTWPNLVKVGQRSKSYGYIMYSGKMCYNSITGGHINFVLRANVRTTSNECDTKCLLWKCRLPSNRVKNYGLYDQLGHVL